MKINELLEIMKWRNSCRSYDASKEISDEAPNVYFKNAVNECKKGCALYGNINDIDVLRENMKSNCIPFDITDMDYTNYFDFLNARRKMMAKKIKEYYYNL